MFLLALAPMAKASFVSGQFAPGGTSVEVTANEILFYNLGIPPVVTPKGTFAVDSPATGSFSGLVGDTSSIMDLTQLSGDPSCVGCILAPVDTSLAPNIFMQLPASGTTIDLSLANITAGVDTPGTPICSTLTFAQLTTSGTSCTPSATSPFTLSNVTVSGTLDTFVTLTGTGLAWFTATPTQTSPAVYSFTTSFAGQSIAGVLATIASQGDIVSSLGGDVVVTSGSVPEPGTGTAMLLGGAGLILLSLIRTRGNRRHRS
jgi:hypothetical protein